MTRTLHPADRVDGALTVPGDKSIGHRSLLFGAIAEGTSRIRGLPGGGDVRTTAALLRSLGVQLREDTDGSCLVDGRGWGTLDTAAPASLDCGNSGTTTRLLLGLLAGRSGRYRLHGDESLSRRPMRRVLRPLRAFGAQVEGDDHLPLQVLGGPLRGAAVHTEVASAQVKSACVLAALQAEGGSLIAEPTPTRDHTERMLQAMGAPLRASEQGIVVGGGAHELAPLDLTVPGDPSSAAFWVALAAGRPGWRVRLDSVSLNPRRLGFLRAVERMGARITTEVAGSSPEPFGAIEVEGARLHGIDVAPDEVIDGIDELVVFGVLAALAEGTSTVRGASELRVKESDRVAKTVELLRAFGAEAEELPDGYVVSGPTALVGARIDAGQDHRIAMAAAIAAAHAKGPSELVGDEWAAISYPSFFADLASLASA